MQEVQSFEFLKSTKDMDISLKLINITAFVREHPSEIFVRRSAIILSIVFMLCYAYLASAAVYHAVVQRSAEVQSEHLKTELSRLEREYFTLGKAVDPTGSSAIGLSKVVNKSFVERAVLIGQANVSSGI